MATLSEALAIAIAHHQAGRLEMAEDIYRRILAVEPDHADAWHLLGLIAHQCKQHDAAARHLQRAIGLNPTKALFHYNLGSVRNAQANCVTAIAAYRRALELKPDYVEAFTNLGSVLQEQGDLDEATVCFRRALELQPDLAQLHINLGHALKDQGQLDEALACFRQALELNPADAEAHSHLAYAQLFCPAYDSQARCEECRRWDQRHAEPLAQFIQPHVNDRSVHRRLRIGYVSPDFCSHAESFFTVPLLAAHDRQDFEIFCYADVPRPDEITARLRGYAHVWRDILGMNDRQVAELVRQDGIDILVDLTMHMPRNRLLVFARKPAPVQVCWLAYQGTTGLSAMDYRLTDAYCDPPGLFDRFYGEQSVRLPDAFGCYDPLDDAPPAGELPALQNGWLTFASLNNFCKINLHFCDSGRKCFRRCKARGSCCWLPQARIATGRSRCSSRKASPLTACCSSTGGHVANTWNSTARSTWASTPCPTTARQQRSTRCGWACL